MCKEEKLCPSKVPQGRHLCNYAQLKPIMSKDEYEAFIKEMGLEFDERDWNR